MANRKYCSDFPGAPPCCDSCHENDEQGYGMIEVPRSGGDEHDAYVCCAVFRYIQHEAAD